MNVKQKVFSACIIAGMAVTTLSACGSAAAVKDSHAFTEKLAVVEESDVVLEGNYGFEETEDGFVSVLLDEESDVMDEDADEGLEDEFDFDDEDDDVEGVTFFNTLFVESEDAASLGLAEGKGELPAVGRTILPAVPVQSAQSIPSGGLMATASTTKFSVKKEEGTRYVTKELYARVSPDVSSKKLGKLKEGDKVKITGSVVGSKWYQIDYNGKKGYVHGKYLASYTISKITASTRYLTASLYLRVLPSTDSTKLEKLKKGSTVTITGKVKGSNWYRVKTEDGTAFVSGKYLSLVKSDKVIEGSKNYVKFMTGAVPIWELDFSGVTSTESKEIIAVAVESGMLFPKESSGYVVTGEFRVNEYGNIRWDMSGKVLTNPNDPNDPAKGTGWEGTSFTGDTYLATQSDKVYKSDKQHGVPDDNYNNPTQKLKDGSTFADYLKSFDYDNTKDLYIRLLIDYYESLTADYGKY